MVKPGMDSAAASTSLIIHIELPSLKKSAQLKFLLEPAKSSRVFDGLFEFVRDIPNRWDQLLLDFDAAGSEAKLESLRKDATDDLESWQSKVKMADEWKRKVDNAANTMNKMRDAYYKELFHLREQVYRQSKVKEGESFQPVYALHFDPGQYTFDDEVARLVAAKGALLEQEYVTKHEEQEVKYNARIQSLNQQVMSSKMYASRQDKLLQKVRQKFGWDNQKLQDALDSQKVNEEKIVAKLEAKAREAEEVAVNAFRELLETQGDSDEVYQEAQALKGFLERKYGSLKDASNEISQKLDMDAKMGLTEFKAWTDSISYVTDAKIVFVRLSGGSPFTTLKDIFERLTRPPPAKGGSAASSKFGRRRTVGSIPMDGGFDSGLDGGGRRRKLGVIDEGSQGLILDRDADDDTLSQVSDLSDISEVSSMASSFARHSSEGSSQSTLRKSVSGVAPPKRALKVSCEVMTAVSFPCGTKAAFSGKDPMLAEKSDMGCDPMPYQETVSKKAFRSRAAQSTIDSAMLDKAIEYLEQKAEDDWKNILSDSGDEDSPDAVPGSPSVGGDADPSANPATGPVRRKSSIKGTKGARRKARKARKGSRDGDKAEVEEEEGSDEETDEDPSDDSDEEQETAASSSHARRASNVVKSFTSPVLTVPQSDKRGGSAAGRSRRKRESEADDGSDGDRPSRRPSRAGSGASYQFDSDDDDEERGMFMSMENALSMENASTENMLTIQATFENLQDCGVDALGNTDVCNKVSNGKGRTFSFDDAMKDLHRDDDDEEGSLLPPVGEGNRRNKSNMLRGLMPSDLGGGGKPRHTPGVKLQAGEVSLCPHCGRNARSFIEESRDNSGEFTGGTGETGDSKGHSASIGLMDFSALDFLPPDERSRSLNDLVLQIEAQIPRLLEQAKKLADEHKCPTAAKIVPRLSQWLLESGSSGEAADTDDDSTSPPMGKTTSQIEERHTVNGALGKRMGFDGVRQQTSLRFANLGGDLPDDLAERMQSMRATTGMQGFRRKKQPDKDRVFVADHIMSRRTAPSQPAAAPQLKKKNSSQGENLRHITEEDLEPVAGVADAVKPVASITAVKKKQSHDPVKQLVQGVKQRQREAAPEAPPGDKVSYRPEQESDADVDRVTSEPSPGWSGLAVGPRVSFGGRPEVIEAARNQVPVNPISRPATSETFSSKSLAKPPGVLKKGTLASGPPLERHTTKEFTLGLSVGDELPSASTRMRKTDSNFKQFGGPKYTSEDSDADSLEDDGVDDVLRKHGHDALSPQRSSSPVQRSNSHSPNCAMTEGMNARLRVRRKEQQAVNAASAEMSKTAASSSAVPEGNSVVSLDVEVSKLPPVSAAARSKGFGRAVQKSRSMVPEDPTVASQMLDFNGAGALRLGSSNGQRRKQPAASKASALPQLTPRNSLQVPREEVRMTSNDVNSDADPLLRETSSKSEPPPERVTFNGVLPSREGSFSDVKRTTASRDAPPRITGSSTVFAAFRGNKGANGPASARK